MSKKMKTLAQNKAIFGLGAKMKCSHEDLQELAYDVTAGRTASIAKLSFEEANGMIVRLGGRAFSPNPPSRRTEQYHRQKEGVQAIATATHLDYMRRLARGRNMSDQGLGDLSSKVNKGERSPRTSKEVNRVIEAIKVMNKRDQTFGAFKKEDKEAA